MTNEAPVSTDDDILRAIEAYELDIYISELELKKHKAELLRRREAEIKEMLQAKDEPFGDITLIVGNHKVKVNVPKKVSWDAKQLAAKYKEIAASGEMPELYMKVEYGISETAFKGWPDEMRDYFMPARAVTPGNPSLKIVAEKE